VGEAIGMTDTLSAELAGYQAVLRENRAFADRIAGGLTLEQFNWRPAPERWSIAQCLVHLNISARLFAERMQAAIRQGRAAGLLGSGPFRYGPVSRWVARAVDPANRKKYKSPAKFVASPAEAYDIREVLGEFHAAGARWEHCLHEADGLDLARVKVRSPAVPLMRFPLGALFGIQAAHERRHLVQADDVLKLQAQR
jgi:DinB superfamily